MRIHHLLRVLPLAFILGISTVFASSRLPQRSTLAAPLGRAVTSSHSPAQTLATLVSHSVPWRNLYVLSNELRLRPPRAIPHVIRRTSPNYPIGRQDTFTVLSEDNLKYFKMHATIRAETAHLYIYVQNGLNVDQSAVAKAAQTFEQHTYPTDRALYGSEWRPGVDGDPHITCLLGNLRSSGAAGFFSAEDEYPHAVNPFSNVREMFYINTNTLPGSGNFDVTLAHEFQHMIHFHVHPRDNAWMNEGMSMLAQRVNGYPASVQGEADSYLQNPSTQLNTWSSGDNTAHYGASYLFLTYLYDRFGRGLIHEIVGDKQLTDMQLINDALRRRHIPETANQVFANWIVANYINTPSISKGAYAYKDLPFVLTTSTTLTYPYSYAGSTAPYTASYIGATVADQQGPFHIHFLAPTTVPVISAGKGPFWWSNRGDLMDTWLERSVNLTHIHRAHLHFQAWYRIEKSYDYAFVEASTDSGKTWTTLRGTGTTTSNPTGGNYGNGYTGKSHGWKNRTVDLSRYAGKRIQIRFEYVTDDETNLQGFAVRAISVPGAGVRGDFSGWKTHGFVPVQANALTSSWNVQAVESTASGYKVLQIPVSPSSGSGSLGINPAADRLKHLTLVVFSAAPKTTVSSPFRISTTSG